ncbi:alpha/beta hydrolase [Cryptosporangium arvum]|uniref:alpha/beta hydrolase n=1 Tax=Cryptosporangium arvum TaxID=80871 RepID=UPI0004B95835|nr:alpha/beta hydrolase [Cryptosporangium arvum]
MVKSRVALAVGLVAVVIAGVVWGPGLVIRLAISGSHPFALDRYYRQDVTWHGCRAGADDPTGRSLDDAGARCTEITVPVDYDEPAGRTLTLAVARRLGTDTDHHLGTLVVHTGNPGGSRDGVLAVLQGLRPDMVHGSPDVAARYDLVGVDSRFTGRSTRLGCGWPGGRGAVRAAPDRRAFDASVAAAKDLAARCAKADDLLPHASTRTLARDLDVVRSALTTERVSYLGWSSGGYLGAVYAQLFPTHVRRVVLDSTPVSPPIGGAADEAVLAHWAGWAAERDATAGLGASPDQVLATVERIRRRAAGAGIAVAGRRVDAATLPGLLRPSADTEAAYARFSAVVRALDGRSGPVEPVPGPTDGETATRCADRPAVRDPESYFRDVQAHRRDEPLFGPLARNVTPCAFWPVEPTDRPVEITSDVPALLIGADGDPVAPPASRRALHAGLSRSVEVTLRGAFRHRVYLYDGNTCVDRLVDDYLLNKTLPPADRDCTRG